MRNKFAYKILIASHFSAHQFYSASGMVFYHDVYYYFHFHANNMKKKLWSLVVVYVVGGGRSGGIMVVPHFSLCVPSFVVVDGLGDVGCDAVVMLLEYSFLIMNTKID